jgi:plastocyanin
MRRLASVAAVYALVAALVLPGSLLAAEAVTEQPAEPVVEQATPAPGGEEPAAEEAPPAEPVPAPSPTPSEQEPAPPPAATQEPAPPEPDPQPLADERKQQPTAKAAQSGTVVITDFQFTPPTITVQQGDTVTWTNEGPTPHSATAPDGSFDTGVFPAGESRSQTFAEAGTFSYICTPHPNMTGTVVVNASQTDGDTPTSDDDAGTTGGDTTGGDTAGGEAAQTGPTLPNSGGQSEAQFLLGALMVLLGALAHQRLRPARPRPAGRIGW